MKRILIQRRKDGYLTGLLEGGKLVELVFDPHKGGSIVGNVYTGIVKKINTGFVFIDIGLFQQAFLDSRDNREQALFSQGKLTVKQGDNLIVQIIKDPLGDKGPVATTSISYNGRFTVLSQSVGSDRISVSRKIDAEESERLRSITKKHIPPGFSAIIRSAAANRREDEIAGEIPALVAKFDSHTPWAMVKPPAPLLAEPPIIKTLREIATEDVNEILTDCTALHSQQPHPRLSLFALEQNIFEHFFVQTQIDKLRDKRVWLKSGAFIVIEQTEACVVIDVNTSKYTGKKSEAVKLKTNLEAAKEIAVQLRLRNLSGIIIIDFIAMKAQSDVENLTAHLRAELAKDRIPTAVVGMTALGLMELTRKRVRSSFTAR